MDQFNFKGFIFSLFVPAVMSGLGDSVNPCNFATLLIFIIVLSNIGHTPMRLFLFGGLFIVLAGGIQFLSVLGSWDHFLTLTIALEILCFGYLLIAAAFLFLGVMHALDWWRYKKQCNTECFKLQLPVFFQDKVENHSLNLKQKIFTITKHTIVVVFVAIFMPFIGAIYPQNEYVFIVHSFLMAGGDKGFAYWSFGLYSFAMVLPLIAAWLVIWFLALRKKRSVKIISYYKGIMAALFFATGIGLGYFFLQ